MKPLGMSHDCHLYAEPKGRALAKRETRQLIDDGVELAEDLTHIYWDLNLDVTGDKDSQ